MGAHLFIYLFIDFVFIVPATVQPRDMPHEYMQARDYSMGARRQRQHDLHLPFPIHVQLA
jgi:hypothetical protein